MKTSCPPAKSIHETGQEDPKKKITIFQSLLVQILTSLQVAKFSPAITLMVTHYSRE